MNPREDVWIIHDTRVICDVSARALELFRCERADLIDVSIFDIIPDPEYRGLARARMKHIRERGDLSEQALSFIRPDGTTFDAMVQTRKTAEGTWVSYISYQGEYTDGKHHFKFGESDE